jgi:hypothetical protein
MEASLVALVQQLPVLVGVAMGALASFLATSAVERARWRRLRETRWDEKRVDAYGEFADVLQRHAMLSQRIVAARGLDLDAQPLSPEEGLGQLAAVEADRGAKWQKVLLLGDAKTVVVGQNWQVEVWRAEWFARGLLTDPDEWKKTRVALTACRFKFYDSARGDLGIIGSLPPPGPAAEIFPPELGE